MAKTVIDKNPYYFTSWMDSRPVHGLSTLPTTKSMVQRKTKETPDAPFTVTEVPRPDMWGYYNHGMGGTDLHDQFNKYYRTTVRCNKWPIRIFTHFLTSCVTNAYILYKSAYGLETKDISLKTFIQEIIALVKVNFDDNRKAEAKQAKEEAKQAARVDSDSGSDDEAPRRNDEYKKRKKLPVHVRLDNEGHYARLIKSTENDKIKNRGGCRMCKAKVSTKCHKCDAYLCIDSTGDTTCFERFYEQEMLPQNKMSYKICYLFS